jgi:Uma2 family endonuclease
MAALPKLMTVAEYWELPEGGEVTYELQHGEVIDVTRPKAWHAVLQVELQDSLRTKLMKFGRVVVAWAYRPVPEFELRAADVALVSWERWRTMDRNDALRGAPDLVIEVKSPSNTRRQLQELMTLCLNNGATEFWVVDGVNAGVTVTRRDGSVTLYRRGDAIPLQAFGSDELLVADIFPGK